MIRKVLRSIARFVRLLSHKPPENPAMREMNAAAKRAQKHMFTGPGKSFSFHGTGGAREKLVGDELAEGHRKARKAKPD